MKFKLIALCLLSAALYGSDQHRSAFESIKSGWPDEQLTLSSSSLTLESQEQEIARARQAITRFTGIKDSIHQIFMNPDATDKPTKEEYERLMKSLGSFIEKTKDQVNSLDKLLQMQKKSDVAAAQKLKTLKHNTQDGRISAGKIDVSELKKI